jgi:hypothetical protein
MNTNTHLNSKRLRRATRWRFNPMRNLTVDSLTNQLDAFEAGYLREAVETWDLIEKRDDILRCVVPKRVKAIARHGWVVLPARELADHEKAEAQKHIAALEYFYRNLETANAVDTNERGGFALLVRQMMDAIGKRYAVHEIIWRPKADGTLSACFRFVPLSFFENTTGQLRFLETENAMEGAPLRDGEWMTTVGDGLMMASSIAWMFKHLSLNDWSLYSEHNGTPGLRATTSATRDSDEWKAIESTVQDLYEGMPVVTNTGDDIKVVDFAVGGNIPFPGLVERMDRVLAAMWRGADLSTLSRDRGYGASLQEKESCVLEQDDGELVAETLHRYVDRWVVRYLFGENVEPLARVKVLVSGLPATADDARIDEFLLKHGAPLSVASVLERYGRAVANPGEPILNTPGAEHASSGVMSHMENSRGAGTESAANIRLSNAADSAFSLLQKEWVQLSPYGDFPHAQGLQRVSFEAAREMERAFTTLASRASRLFAGAPMFVGHPDVPQFANQFPDRKAYGWIMALEARPDGLYGKMKWSAAGLELLQNGHYKFLSPYWEARQVGEENGRTVYEPVSLISAGLTNEPNLPVLPLANTKHSPVLANIREAIEDALANGRLAPGRIVEMQHELAEDWEVASAKLRAAPIVMHTRAYTEKLGARKNESGRFSNRRSRIQEQVAHKMSQGLGYDQAWGAVKEEHPALFS